MTAHIAFKREGVYSPNCASVHGLALARKLSMAINRDQNKEDTPDTSPVKYEAPKPKKICPICGPEDDKYPEWGDCEHDFN